MFMDRMELKGLYWQYSNGTRVPVVDRGEPSDLDVYVERYAGSQVPAQKPGREFFISLQHNLLLGTILVSPSTTRR